MSLANGKDRVSLHLGLKLSWLLGLLRPDLPAGSAHHRAA